MSRFKIFLAQKMMFFCLVVFTHGPALAVGPGTKKPTLATRTPVSLSFQEITRCRSDLADPSMKTQVDLTLLKSLVDARNGTQRSRVKSRKVEFRDNSGQLRRLTLESKFIKARTQWTAQWSTLLPSGEVQEWNDPSLKTHPDLKEVHLVIAKGVIEKDETLTEDFKLRGVKLLTRKGLQKIHELRLEDEPGKWSLFCEDKPEIGAICTCTKK